MSQDKLTSMLNQLRRSKREDAATELVYFVWDTAYRCAEKRISEELRRRVSASDIVNAALRSAFSVVEKSPDKIPNREWFEALVKTIISRRIKDAVDHHIETVGRSVKRETGEPVEAVAVEKQASGAAGQAIAKDYSIRLAEILLEEPTEERRLAVVLGILAGHKAGEIQKTLEKSVSQGKKTYSVSAIHVWLRTARQRVEEKLGTKLDD